MTVAKCIDLPAECKIHFLKENMLDKMNKIIHNVKIIKYPQVILGNESHPRKTVKKYEVPDILKDYTGSAEFMEAACLISGKCVIAIEGSSYKMEPGDLCVIKHGVKHYESYIDKSTPYEMMWLGYSSVFRLRIHHAKYSQTTGYRIDSVISMKIKGAAYLLLENIFEISEPKKEFAKIKDLLLQWFDNISDNLKKSSYIFKECGANIMRSEALKEKRIIKAVNYLHKHYTEKLKLKDLADQIPLSPAYFAELFEEIYNHPLHEYITELKMKKSYELLRTTDLTVNEISSKAGYDDPLFFRHIFKKYTGVSPREYRLRGISIPMVISPKKLLWSKKKA